MAKQIVQKFQPGDRVTYSGFAGRVIRQYSGNMYEVRLASGLVCVCASDLRREDTEAA